MLTLYTVRRVVGGCVRPRRIRRPGVCRGDRRGRRAGPRGPGADVLSGERAHNVTARARELGRGWIGNGAARRVAAGAQRAHQVARHRRRRRDRDRHVAAPGRAGGGVRRRSVYQPILDDECARGGFVVRRAGNLRIRPPACSGIWRWSLTTEIGDWRRFASPPGNSWLTWGSSPTNAPPAIGNGEAPSRRRATRTVATCGAGRRRETVTAFASDSSAGAGPFHESRSLLWTTGLGQLHGSSKGRALNMR